MVGGVADFHYKVTPEIVNSLVLVDGLAEKSPQKIIANSAFCRKKWGDFPPKSPLLCMQIF